MKTRAIMFCCIAFASCILEASCLPLNPNRVPIDSAIISRTARQTIREQHPSANLTFSPWPKLPYDLRLDGVDAYIKVLHVAVYTRHPRIKVLDMQDLLTEFAENLEAEYPVPGSIPARACQQKIDVESLTRLTVSFKEIPFRSRLPTKVALAVLRELRKQIARHAASSFDGLIRSGTVKTSTDAWIAIEIAQLLTEMVSSNTSSGFAIL